MSRKKNRILAYTDDDVMGDGTIDFKYRANLIKSIVINRKKAKTKLEQDIDQFNTDCAMFLRSESNWQKQIELASKRRESRTNIYNGNPQSKYNQPDDIHPCELHSNIYIDSVFENVGRYSFGFFVNKC